MGDRIKLGSILLWPRKGVLSGILAPLIRYLDPDPWVREHYRLWYPYWHMSFVCGYNTEGDWIVRNVDGRGATYPLLSDLPSNFKVVNWIQEPIPQSEIDLFCRVWGCQTYDKIGYVWAAINRLTKRWHPKVVDNDLYCWEDVSNFCDWCRKPFMKPDAMAWMPELVKQIN